MDLVEFCMICGNAHEGGCSTEVIYFDWIPQEWDRKPTQVYIVGDWNKWAKKQKMNKIQTQNGNLYFSISLALKQGHHQYKYVVDGVWRYDQNSPFDPNGFGSFNNVVQILPKKSYLRKHPGQLLKITSDFCIQNLKITGSWDNWQTQKTLNLIYNPLKKCQENEIYLDLQPNKTYQFKFKHGNQYFIDQKYPTVNNDKGTLNNSIFVYSKKIVVETPNKFKIESSPSPSKIKNFKGKFFNWKKVQEKLDVPYDRVQGHSMCSIGQYLYIFGGKSRCEFYNTLLKINLTFDKVQFLEVYPDGRAFHSMTPYGNKIVIYGGNNKQVLSDYQVFNVSEMKWHTTISIAQSSVNKKCEKQSCVIFQSLLIFFGGCYNAINNQFEKLSDQIQVLDLQKMQWIQFIRLQGHHPLPRFAHSAEILNTEMYIFGGLYNFINQNLNDLWKINLTNVNELRWIKLNPGGIAPQPRHGHSMNHLKDLLVVFGGINDRNQLLNDVFVYSSSENTWIKPMLQGQPPRPRVNHASVSILDSKIIIFGGKTNDKYKNNQFNILEPAQFPILVDFLKLQNESESEQSQKIIQSQSQ